MQIGLGGLSCQRYPADTRTDADMYREALAVAEDAERLGFDSIWCSEHHFLDDSFLPSLLPFCAAVAARTSRLAIGTDVLLAPLHETLRIAEDAAVVDLISGGRLVLGIGQGWRPEEFEGLGVPLRGRHRRFEEQVAVLRQAWSDGLVTGGELLRYPGVAVTPKPAQAGGPPIWIGAGAEPALRRAGRIADGFLASWPTLGDFAQQVAWVREELEATGRDPAAFTFALSVPTVVWEESGVWERVRPHLWYAVWRYDVIGDMRGSVGPPAAAPPLTAEREAELRRFSILGSPDEVVEQIRAYERAAGGGFHFIADICLPGLDGSLLQEQVTLFAEQVLPRLERSY